MIENRTRWTSWKGIRHPEGDPGGQRRTAHPGHRHGRASACCDGSRMVTDRGPDIAGDAFD
jgi:hypothetical protein